MTRRNRSHNRSQRRSSDPRGSGILGCSDRERGEVIGECAKGLSAILGSISQRPRRQTSHQSPVSSLRLEHQATSAVRHLNTWFNRDWEIHGISDKTEFMRLFMEMFS